MVERMKHDDDGRGGLVPVGDITIDALGDRRSRCHPTHTRQHRWHTGPKTHVHAAAPAAPCEEATWRAGGDRPTGGRGSPNTTCNFPRRKTYT